MRIKNAGAALALGLFAVTAWADGEAILKSQCGACHNLTGPAPTTLQALWDRKGPDLFYAGNKYQAAWLEQWLQKPVRIRPAGMFYAAHVKPGPKGDEVDASTLVPHPALSAADAKAVTAALMTRKAGSELIKAGAYTPGAISRSSGEMMFDKFKGCLACHEIEPGYGGLSGPEVYTAGRRLREDYLVSYLRNPQAWDPKIFMPNKHLSDTDIQKFINYFRLLSEEGAP
ncbi:MAG: c-type cytochrome [Gammaproteobacteria bacterium]|nr:c-type cytochrome [Gammaproteobacteria bacterium]